MPEEIALQSVPLKSTSTTANKPEIIHPSIERGSIDVVSIPRGYNNQEEVEELTAETGVKKNNYSIMKTLYLGFLAGLFVSLSGILSITAAGGLSPVLRAENPSVPKLVFGALFPVGLFLIVLFGGDLFTGNTMVMTVAFLHGRISALELLKNWVLVFISNFLGCLSGAYLFAYVTEIWIQMQIDYLIKIVETKANLPAYVTFFRAIPANGLVCLAIFMGLTARDVIGKIYGMWFPIFAFAVIGYEHCVANMFFFSAGLMFGAQVTAGQVTVNITCAVLGNIVGGAFLVGCSEVYLYHWRHVGDHKKDGRPGMEGKVEPHGIYNREAQLLKERWSKICQKCFRSDCTR